MISHGMISLSFIVHYAPSITVLEVFSHFSLYGLQVESIFFACAVRPLENEVRKVVKSKDLVAKQDDSVARGSDF